MTVTSLLPFNLKSGLFVRTSPTKLAESLVQWGNEDRVRRGTVARSVVMPLEQALLYLQPRDFNPTRALVTLCGAKWSAFLDNHSRQFLPQAELYNACRLLDTDGYFFSYDHDEQSEHFGSAQFNANDARSGLGRQVILYRESGWRFQCTGDPLSFEDLAAYQRTRKCDRLNPDILKSYGHALEMPFWDPSAYGSELVLLNWNIEQPGDTQSALQKVPAIFGRVRQAPPNF